MTHAEPTPIGGPDHPAGPLPSIPGVPTEHELVDLSMGRMHVARAGDPSLPALLLLHGFPQHWWCWAGVAGELASNAHLVMPDLRGSGWSDTPRGPKATSKRAAARDLVELLDALGIDRVAVVGHDWGAFLGQLLALDHPERVRALMVWNIPAAIPTPRPPLRSLMRMSYQLTLSAPFSDRVLRVRSGAAIARGMRQDVRQRENFSRQDAAGYARQYRDPDRARFGQGWYRSFVGGEAAAIYRATRGRRFLVPARFVLSAHDAYIPPEFERGLERLGDDVTAELQDRTGHFVADEDPAYVADEIRRWALPMAAPLPGGPSS